MLSSMNPKMVPERKPVQIQYGHRGRPALGEQPVLFPPRLWRDHADPEVRGFYGVLNEKSSGGCMHGRGLRSALWSRYSSLPTTC